LAGDSNSRDISKVIAEVRDDPFVLRYIADALENLSSVDSAIALIRDSPVSPEIAISLAGDAGIPAFDSREIIRHLTEPASPALTASLGYIAVNPHGQYSPYLEDLVQNGVSGFISQAAGIALSAVENLFGNRPEVVDHSPTEGKKPLVLQTVFYGDPTRPGRGGSGGIGTLVLRLGNAIASGGDGAVTFVPEVAGHSGGMPEQRKILKRHVLYRFPVALGGEGPMAFLLHRPGIIRAFRRTLELTGLRPDVVHVRFLDDASLAVVRASKAMGLSTAVTLTPDPHRQLAVSEGGLRRLEKIEDFMVLHRIWVGDEMARECRGLMGIGRDAMRKDIMAYFPDTSGVRGRILASVDEGVPLNQDSGKNPPPVVLESGLVDSTRPIILCVGRLSPIKNFPAMASAWTKGLWHSHNLLLIGGDMEHPSDEESRIIGEIRQQIAAAPPGAQGRAVHLTGQDPETIQAVEAWLAVRRSSSVPNLYVAPSLKEEFGLAILEAMGAGMVACAPIRGGAGTYIRSGVNGFLIDTRDADHLLRDIGRISSDLASRPRRSAAMGKAARETVRTRYSIEAMAREYRGFYRNLGNA
jgi:glycosyltransferase involved in cell wall biosynthesis